MLRWFRRHHAFSRLSSKSSKWKSRIIPLSSSAMFEAQVYNLRVGTARGSPKWEIGFTSASFATTVKHIQNTWLIAPFVALLPCLCTRAQTSTTGFFPEADLYARLTSNVRLVLQAKGYMEEGDFTRAQLGPSSQFNPRPSEKLRKMTVFDMDYMKPMPVVFEIGYRYLPSATGPSTNRLEPLVMFHIPMPGRILVIDRNRADLDWSNNNFTWRYRKQNHGRAPRHDSQLPSRSICQRRVLLPEPIFQVEFHTSLRWLPAAVEQT